MNAGAVQLATNRAGVRHLNSVHGIVLHPIHRRLGRDLLPLTSLNSMTLLGSEIVGRAYGGGMLKLEPREADLLPVPAASLLAGSVGRKMRDLRPAMTRLLRLGGLEQVVDLVDQIVLVEGLALDRSHVAALARARRTLASRRAARGRGPSSSRL
jgi:hypothetical protein